MQEALTSFSVSRILHAGYIFEAGGERIVMDPVLESPFSHNCYAFPAVRFNEKQISELQLNAIFISHVHDDHLCFKSLNRLNRKTPVYLYAEDPIYFEMLKRLGFKNLHQLKVNQTVTVGKHFRITPRLALDPQVDTIFQIQMGQFNVLNVVDSWVDPEALQQMKDIRQWDLVLWPFQTMRELQVLSPNRSSREKEIPQEWAEVLQKLQPKFVVPSSCQFRHESWSWYNQSLFPIQYSDFKKWLSQILPQTEYLRIDPSKGFCFSKDGAQSISDLKILECLENNEVDYEYNQNALAPTVGAVAVHLSVLSEPEAQWVLNYCRQDLVKELAAKADSLGCLINDRCLWKLVLHVDVNQKYTFVFDITHSAVELLKTHEVERPTWLTEIPIQKLFSSLKSGETLTSLYLRINDMIFEPDIEQQLEELDILEDPLIRVLFDDKAFRYHQQQLTDLGL